MNKGRILVVDDTTESLKLLTSILSAEGYEVRPANSGELALACASTLMPELILLDIRMPGINGFEVFERLRDSEDTKHVPVMFISASVELEDQIKGLRLGAVDFVSKPFQNEEVMARVQTHLELSRLRTQLQDQVEERTAELKVALDLLEAELAERKRLEEHMKAFYRETICAATGGKLVICDKPDLTRYKEQAELRAKTDDPSGLTQVRAKVRQFLADKGLGEPQLDDAILGFGEMVDNAVKHCGGGRVYAGADADSVWMGVSDDGPGIDSLVLPKATLHRGFSTKGSMGLGYSMLLQVADQIYLSTTSEGTDVVFTKNLKSDETFDLDAFPDTWDAIPNPDPTD